MNPASHLRSRMFTRRPSLLLVVAGGLLFQVISSTVPVRAAGADGATVLTVPDAPIKYPSIKGHPIPAVAYFDLTPTLKRDPFVSAVLTGPATLIHPERKEDAFAATGYDERDFFNEITSAAGSRLTVSAVILSGEDGVATDRAVINQKAFASGEQFPVQVETSEPQEFIKYADSYKVPYLVLTNPAPARPVKSPTPVSKPVGLLCVFLEVGKITDAGVNIQFPGNHSPLAFLPFQPVMHLQPVQSESRPR